MKNQRNHRRGIALVWLAICMIVFIGFVGLGTDVGWLVLSAQQLQTGADAAALAGARYVKVDHTLTRDAAVAVGGDNKAAGSYLTLNRNDGNAPDGDVVVGRYDQNTNTFTPQLEATNAVKVVARRVSGVGDGGVQLTFGRAFNVDEVSLQRYAIAVSSGGTGAGMIVLCEPNVTPPPPPDSDCECALDLGGTSTSIDVSGGAVQVNSPDECAVCNNGNSSLNAPTLNVAGESCWGGSGAYPEEINEGAPPIPDPLANLPEPTQPLSPAPPPTGPDDARIYSPGWYPDGLEIGNGVTATFQPGLYYIDNGFEMIGNLTGNGVMLFIHTGEFNLGTGTSQLTLSAMNPVDHPDQMPDSATYEHVTVFQSRYNYSEARIQGFPGTIQGTFYFPRNHVEIQGGSGAIGNQLIAWTVEAIGNAQVTINYDGSFVSAGFDVYLVE
jgi:Flp pilus assembly protein TadG